ncbi:hypothetical protein Clacol_002529 [Clathrus columnatus]|uniref:Uncharacterized protein n=1 Tax=Clathrus columnatus TaxID=1419009 RepID=A0AAV5A547_9AGAM|nr:hypothetical protein Clacol_002529 [Clathrus columnatus]
MLNRHAFPFKVSPLSPPVSIMTKNAIVALLIFISSLKTVLSQAQFTVPDPNVPGGSIVEISTLDVNGIPTVSILESIPPDGVVAPGVPTSASLTTSSTSSSTSSSITPPPTQAPAVPAGPVGAPPQTTIPVGEGTTLFTYTTVIAGETEIFTGTFTPTYNSLPPPPSPTAGTILNINQFHSQFGTSVISSARSSQSHWLSASNIVTIFTVLCGIAAGAFLTM